VAVGVSTREAVGLPDSVAEARAVGVAEGLKEGERVRLVAGPRGTQTSMGIGCMSA
jgi:hypothetical protein